jgi:mannose-6-phosphate isomerase-like protein (cupin superfamily)
VELDGEVTTVRANESIYVHATATHRLQNAGDETLVVVEVAVGSYLGEDDIARYEDDWGR